MLFLKSRRLLGIAGWALPLIAAVFASWPAAAIETQATHALLLDMRTGTVLFAKEADRPMPPASMSKMMTAYMLFERLKDGRLSLDDQLPVTENAWRKGGAKSGGSTMFLEPGARVRVEDLIRGIVIQSGNDACIVVAEALSGNEDAFAVEMTRRAHDIGLVNSTFRNATGWPDPKHLTTAHDLAILARRTMEDHSEYYHYYSEKSFNFNGITQTNRNPLLYRDIGADGLKTGHTEISGYGLTASAKRGERRLILVINGLPSIKARSQEAETLLDWGFREFQNYALFKAGDRVADADVWLGTSASVPLTIDQEVMVTLSRKARPGMKVTARYQGPLAAPVKRGSRVGTLVVTAPETEKLEFPVTAAADVERLGLFGRLAAALQHVLWGESR